MSLVGLTKLIIEIYKYIKEDPYRFFYGNFFKGIVIITALSFAISLVVLNTLSIFLLAYENLTLNGFFIKLTVYTILIFVAVILPYIYYKQYDNDVKSYNFLKGKNLNKKFNNN